MGQINGWSGMKKYGIGFLTGEADAYSIRGLCDVNQKGKELLEKFFGGTIEIRLNTNWNSKVNGEESIGSIMLPYGILKELATFCLFQVDGYYCAIYHRDDSILGAFEEDFKRYQEFMPEIAYRLNWAYKADPSISRDGRNVHQMSGRVE